MYRRYDENIILVNSFVHPAFEDRFMPATEKESSAMILRGINENKAGRNHEQLTFLAKKCKCNN